MKIAFYAPLKAPDHPIPSGDREMARLLIEALRLAGHEVSLTSQLRSFSQLPHGDTLHAAADDEVARIADAWSQTPDKVPDLWFSYHPYYKAPDLLAVPLAARFGFAMATAEASIAAKRDGQGWGLSQDAVRRLVSDAAVNFCLTERDRAGLLTVCPADRVLDLAPFIDVRGLEPAGACDRRAGPVRLLAVAMMRPGVKVDSYRQIGKALGDLHDLDWRLTIAGDGAARSEVEAAFAALPGSRIDWRGAIAPEGVCPLMADHDILVWPGVGEAYGMVYLQAGAMGLPAVALDTHGVPSVVRGGETGLLADPGDPAAYTAALRHLIEDADLRRSLGARAARWVRAERSLERAATLLDAGMRQALERGP